MDEELPPIPPPDDDDEDEAASHSLGQVESELPKTIEIRTGIDRTNDQLSVRLWIDEGPVQVIRIDMRRSKDCDPKSPIHPEDLEYIWRTVCAHLRGPLVSDIRFVLGG